MDGKKKLDSHVLVLLMIQRILNWKHRIRLPGISVKFEVGGWWPPQFGNLLLITFKLSTERFKLSVESN